MVLGMRLAWSWNEVRMVLGMRLKESEFEDVGKKPGNKNTSEWGRHPVRMMLGLNL